MPTNINGTSEDSQIQAPVSGEPGSAALLIKELIRPVANKIEFIRSYVNQTRDNILGLNSPHIIGINLDCGNAGAYWTKNADATSSRTIWRQQNEAVGSQPNQLQFEITQYLPNSGTIVELGGEFIAGSSHSAIPVGTYRPRVEIRRVSRQSASSEFGEQWLYKYDKSASIEEYQGIHPIKVLSDSFNIPPAVPIDTSYYRYYIRVYGEMGPLFKAGFTVNGLYVKVRL